MHDELTELAQHTAMRPPTRASGTVADLARPVLSVGSSMPVGQLEVVFRNPGVTCVVVHDDEVPSPGAPAARTGVVVRSSLVAALTGRAVTPGDGRVTRP